MAFVVRQQRQRRRRTQPARFNSVLSVALLTVILVSSQQQLAAAFVTARQQPFTTNSRSSSNVIVMKNDNSNDSADNNNNNNNTNNKIELQTWNPLRLLVLRLGFTEPAWTSPFNYGKKDGTFRCAYCGNTLFDSTAKYDSGSGWPSFWRSVADGSISYKREFDGRLECRCGKCTSHLGHVFLDGPLPSQVPAELLEASPSSDPKGRQENGYLPRFCINGASMRYDERK